MYMQNISSYQGFGKFLLIVIYANKRTMKSILSDLDLITKS